MNSPPDAVVHHGTKSSHSGAVITVETPDGEVLGVVQRIAVHSPVCEKAFDGVGGSVSAWWSVNPDVAADRGIEHVVAVHRDATRALFRVEAGSWEAVTTDRMDKKGKPIKKSAFWFQTIDAGTLFGDVVGPMVTGSQLAREARRTPSITGRALSGDAS